MGIAEVKFIVADKKLYAALKALEGMTLQPPVVHVPEGIANGATKVVKPAIGVTGVVRNLVKGKKVITPAQMRAETEACGFTYNAYSYAIKQMLKSGEIKRNKTGGYDVL